jgi:predicted permease
LLSPSDDRPGAPLVAVASYDYWVRALQQRPDVAGQVLRINDLPVTLVGVSPRGFVGANVGATADLTMVVSAIAQLEPAAASLLKPGNFWLRVLARPQPSLTSDAALARLNTVWPQVSSAVVPPNWPASQQQELVDSTFQASSGGTGWTYLREIYRKPLFVLMAVVGLVLLIACANVASLLLARASARRREVAVRLAIGAGRGRIVRQLLIESLMLSLFGAACGVGLAWLSGRALVNVIASGPITIDFDLSPNWHVLLFATLIAVATALLFGVVPALQATRVSSSAVLKDDGRMSGSRGRLLAALVSAQVALSLVLLAGGGLFVRTLQNLRQINPGFDATDVLLVQLDSAATPVSRELLDEVRRVPGVTMASVATHTPLSGAFWSEPAVPAGQTIPEKDTSLFVATSPDGLGSLRIRLLDGREFSESDTKSSAPVAVVNRAYADKYFGREHVVGERLSAKIRNVRYDLEIVGVAENTSLAGLRKDPPLTIYVPYSQFAGKSPSTLIVRGRDAGGRVSAGVQRLLQSRLPLMPIDVDALTSQVDASLVQERMLATLAGAFGLLALALACIGLYGLLAYSVAQRTKEIGIRMALGAPARRVVRLVLRGAAGLVATGVFVGLPAAWAASRFVEGMLFGVTPADPIAIGGAVAVLALAAQVAAFLPARRASRVDPLVALRHE